MKLYVFLGSQPTIGGCKVTPRLPADWPSLSITRIHLHHHVLDISVRGKKVEVVDHEPGAAAPEVKVPAGWTAAVRRG